VGIVHVHGKQVTVAATRTLAQGQESAMAAYNHLREHFHPAVIALTGIAEAFTGTCDSVTSS
jgi:adenosylhomocysteine nucleosidase